MWIKKEKYEEIVEENKELRSRLCSVEAIRDGVYKLHSFRGVLYVREDIAREYKEKSSIATKKSEKDIQRLKEKIFHLEERIDYYRDKCNRCSLRRLRPMKIRKDFVTNSSSSSFLICKKYLDDKQIDAIRNHSELGERLGLMCAEEAWNIKENDMFITGYTCMDNYDIGELFKICGINSQVVTWGEYMFALPDDVSKEEEKNIKGWQEHLKDIMDGIPGETDEDELDELIEELED